MGLLFENRDQFICTEKEVAIYYRSCRVLQKIPISFNPQN